MIPLILGALSYFLYLQKDFFFNKDEDVSKLASVEKSQYAIDSTDVWRENNEAEDSLKMANEIPERLDTVTEVVDYVEPPVIKDEPVKKEKIIEPKVEPKKAVEEQKIVAKNGEILISIGTYGFKKKAENLASEMRSKGLAVLIKENSKGYKIYMKADSEEEAKKISEKVQQITGEKPFYKKIK